MCVTMAPVVKVDTRNEIEEKDIASASDEMKVAVQRGARWSRVGLTYDE